MKNINTFYYTLCLVVIICVGCGEPVAPPTVSNKVVTEVQLEKEKNSKEEGISKVNSDEQFEMKVAGVGATGKGEYGVTSEQPMSIVTVPISTYFRAQEKSVFNIQIPQALSLFQASEGRFPSSEDEFMRSIIQANQIVLPELPEGDSYVYDVESHTLMIKTRK